jgi:S-adenosyl-L-methionine hydrolase (adenosine-forming)
VGAIVTLTTDFGVQDSFVGTMKGVILSRCPDAQLVDITHEVPPQQVRSGALRLAAAAPFFPPGTVHLAVVDPGVGSARRAIAIEADGYRFVGPDNGLLSFAAPRAAPGWYAVEIANRQHMLQRVSPTFHGRDVFAPAAAHLANGGALADLGPEIPSVEELHLYPATREDQRLVGSVLDVDHFGNLTTNVRAGQLANAEIERVCVGSAEIGELSRWYDPSHELIALINSDGWLEIAAPGGNASACLGVGIDAPVQVWLRGARSTR